jgi:hypothetical protein
MPLETAQDVKRTRDDLNDIGLARAIAGKHSRFAEPLRASSHAVPVISV